MKGEELGRKGKRDVLLHITMARIGRNLEGLIMIWTTLLSNSAGMKGEPLPARSNRDEIRAEWHSSSRMLPLTLPRRWLKEIVDAKSYQRVQQSSLLAKDMAQDPGR
jgi:hypothetical protein